MEAIWDLVHQGFKGNRTGTHRNSFNKKFYILIFPSVTVTCIVARGREKRTTDGI